MAKGEELFAKETLGLKGLKKLDKNYMLLGKEYVRLNPKHLENWGILEGAENLGTIYSFLDFIFCFGIKMKEKLNKLTEKNSVKILNAFVGHKVSGFYFLFWD